MAEGTASTQALKDKKAWRNLRKNKVSIPTVEWVRERVVGNEIERQQIRTGADFGQEVMGRIWARSDLIWETDTAWNVLGAKSSKNSWEVMAVVQLKDSGLHHGDGNGNGEIRSNSRCILKVEPTWFADTLNVRQTKESRKHQFLAWPTANVELPSTEMGQTDRHWFRGTDLEFHFEHVRLRCLRNQPEISNSQFYI